MLWVVYLSPKMQSGVVYQFSDYGSWNDMLPHASQVIEAARLAGQTSVRLVAMGRPYLYDLANMVQTNEHTQVQRPIRRIERDPRPEEKPKSVRRRIACSCVYSSRF